MPDRGSLNIMSKAIVAPGLQRLAKDFFTKLGWSVQEVAPNGLLSTKGVAGKELTWGIRFEDDSSFSQLPAPNTYMQTLATQTTSYDFLDIIAVDKVANTHRWLEEVVPWLDERLGKRRNRQWGTWTSFLNRFAVDIAAKQHSALAPLYDKHRIRTPIPTFFKDGSSSAFRDCSEWLASDISRIMLVVGDPGAGKSVFALSLSQHLGTQFKAEPQKYPAPFLIWFSSERPASFENLISFTLQELKVTDLTVDAVKFLLSQGRIVLVIDGFDEISRALAHQAEAT